MKIAWVSSWPPRHCGIATYSNELVKALRAQGHHVEVICHPDGGKKGEKHVHPILDMKDDDWDDKLYKVVNKIKPDVLQVQHEYALYDHEDDQSAGLFRAFFKLDVEAEFPIVVTYHSVYQTLDRVQRDYMDVSLRLINAAIFHEEYQKIYLPTNIGWVPDNVYVIPHGAKDIKPYKDAKRDFGLEGKKVVGLIGWWEPNKGFERVIKHWPQIRKEVGKDAVLVVAGDARPGSSSGQIYKPKLLNAIRKSPAKNSILTIVSCFSPEEYDHVLSTFDLAVLPYNRASQSGNLAHSFAMGVPAVVSAMEGLKAEVERSGAGIAVKPEDDFELKHAIIHLMKSDGLRKKYAANAAKYVTSKIKWSIVARKHASLYEKVIKELHEEKIPKKKETFY